MKLTRTMQLTLFVTVLTLFTMGCGAVNTLLSGGKSAGTVGNLWPDVPPFAGAQKTDLQLPLAAQLVMQTVMKSMNQNNVGMDYIAYTTDKTPSDVQNFYTQERMQAAGWNSEGQTGCTGENTNGSAQLGSLCLFGKKEGVKDVGLAIVVAQDDSTKKTQIFYVRFSATSTPTPK